MRALMWFRADLRVTDNPALHAACKAATRGVLGVFVLCPGQWWEHDWGDVKVEFLLRNLACLSERLKRLHIPLLICEAETFRAVPEALGTLARRQRCDALYFNREYEVNEARRDRAVRTHFERAGLSVHAFDDQTILPSDVLRTSQGSFYTVFTPFRRTWLAHAREGGIGEPLSAPRPQPDMPCPADTIPERVSGFDLSLGLPDEWPAGEKHALRQLDQFISRRLSEYKRLRDVPAVDGTSRLSPYVAAGVISARQCLAAAVEANNGRLSGGRVGAEAWITELVWREFYRHVLVGFPRVGMNRAFRVPTDDLPWRYDERQFEVWREGCTGFPIVDAGMRQLGQTGWMHNRLRMITAMFLTKDLFIDWRWGERYFMRQLIDGDLASNNGGWQWSASTGTDAAPYFRIFNATAQSRKIDPQGDFIRRWVPELVGLDDRAIHDPAPAYRKRFGYPAPMCDHNTARAHAIAAFKRLRTRAR